jgi:hypothetical protein
MKYYHIDIYDWVVSLQCSEETSKVYSHGPFWSDAAAVDKMIEVTSEYESMLKANGIYFLKYVRGVEVKYDIGHQGRIFILSVQQSGADNTSS